MSALVELQRNFVSPFDWLTLCVENMPFILLVKIHSSLPTYNLLKYKLVSSQEALATV